MRHGSNGRFCIPALLFVSFVFAPGCSDDSGRTTDPDGAVDAAAVDGSITDAAPGPDSTPADAEVDAGPPDLCDGVPTVSGTALATELVADGLLDPVHITAPPTDIDRIFIVEQAGTIRVVESGVLLTAPFMDISSRVSCCSERGLLGLAFHPDYAANGRFFVNYTDVAGDTTVSEFSVTADPNVADDSSEVVILTVDQPAANHNGGQVAFGPDGFLYIGLGDGGGSGDPGENGQNPNTLLGAMLRIDVDAGQPYGIPPDNPYVMGGGLPEIFAIGLRNPWRFSFDRETGDLYIGDVGQGAQEEVSVGPDVDDRGLGFNYGWDDCEGELPFEGTCDNSVPPVLVYPHGQGCSVTGGFVYRGCRMPDLHGTYFYADYCQSWVRTFLYVGGAATARYDRTADLGLSAAAWEITSFGEDARGELYIAMYGSGQVLRIVPGP